MMIMIVRPILMLLVFAQQVMLFFCFAFDFITPSSITKILHYYYCCCCCLKTDWYSAIWISQCCM